MRICVIGPSKLFFSGLTAHTIFLANALTTGNDVSVILLRKLLPRFLYPGRNHVGLKSDLIDFVPGINVFEGMDWYSPRSWGRSCRFQDRQKPEVIIMLWWSSSIAHMQLLLAIANRYKTKAKLILEMHEVVDPLEERILPIRLYSKLMGRILMRYVDAVSVHSMAVKQEVIERYKLSEENVFVVPFGVYEAYNQPRDKSLTKNEHGIDEEFVILHFGSIRKYKGVSHLVDAFSQLPESVVGNSRLLIVGEDWGEEGTIESLAGSSAYPDKITVNSCFVPDDKISEYFTVADVVVLPYLRTSGSGVAHIAMAHGKPIITSDLQTMRECLNGYEGAMFTPVGDSAMIGRRILEVYEKHSQGQVVTFDAPNNTWQELVQSYGDIVGQLEMAQNISENRFA